MEKKGKKKKKNSLQDIGEDADRPHVSGEGNRFVVDDLRGTELCRAEEDLDLLPLLEPLGEAEVDDLDVIGLPRHTHHILRLGIRVGKMWDSMICLQDDVVCSLQDSLKLSSL